MPCVSQDQSLQVDEESCRRAGGEHVTLRHPEDHLLRETAGSAILGQQVHGEGERRLLGLL